MAEEAEKESAGKSRRIDPENDQDIRRLADELGVSNLAVIDAVSKVGPRVDDVRRYLDQQMAGGQAGS